MGRSQVQRSVDQMQYREKRAMTTRTTCFGFPSQMRVADSRSYFRMTSFISSAVPTSTSSASLFFFSSLIGGASFSIKSFKFYKNRTLAVLKGRSFPSPPFQHGKGRLRDPHR